MPTFLIIALSLIYVFWSFVEVTGFIALVQRPYLRYSATARNVTYLWFVSLVVLVCYLVSLLF
jgi:hypothetical protein